MPDIDPYNDGTSLGRSVPQVPVLSSTPVIVDAPVQQVSHFGPVTPVAARRRFNPYPYVAGLLLMVVGMWGLFNWARGDDEHEKERAFIAQHVTVKKPNADAAEAPSEEAGPRETQLDRAVSRERLAEAERPVETHRTVEPERPPVSQRPVESERPTQQPPASVEPESSSARPERAASVPVPDFDYSDQEMGVMSEGHLTSALTQLDADIDVSEELTQQAGQTGGLEILEERIDTLKDHFYTSNRPMSDNERLQLTRQVTELRAELSAYQGELYARVTAPQ